MVGAGERNGEDDLILAACVVCGALVLQSEWIGEGPSRPPTVHIGMLEPLRRRGLLAVQSRVIS
jgi:hypothetical protein